MSSRAIVPVGPRHLSTRSTGHLALIGSNQSKGNDKPTTTRALVLRNGKYGVRGTGELMLVSSKLTGREKLELLAGTNVYVCMLCSFDSQAPQFATEDLIQKSKMALANPFRMETCLKIAESQYNGMSNI